MTIFPEQLAAYADGELDEVTATRVRRAIADDPELARELDRLTALRGLLAARFDPILTEPVSERLTAPIAAAAKVVSLDEVRTARRKLWQRPQFQRGAVAAIAASLLVTVMVSGRGGAPAGYADRQLAAALDETMSGQTGPDGTKLLISFRAENGGVCRGYSGKDASGIACRDKQGWKVMVLGGAGAQSTTQYQQAGSTDAAVMAAAQDLAAGPAFDTAAEAAARKMGWVAAR